MDILVGAANVEIYPIKSTIIEGLQKEMRELVERRLGTARLYQENSPNRLSVYAYLYSDSSKDYKIEIEFEKVLYDQATDSWGYATTYNRSGDGLPTKREVTGLLSHFLDDFLESYVEENKAFCR